METKDSIAKRWLELRNTVSNDVLDEKRNLIVLETLLEIRNQLTLLVNNTAALSKSK
jgi:hypothetical protein